MVLISHCRQTGTVLMCIRSLTGGQVLLSALIVSMITTPITNIAETDISQLFHLKKLHLKGPPLAYPILATENFEILLLAAASFY